MNSNRIYQRFVVATIGLLCNMCIPSLHGLAQNRAIIDSVQSLPIILTDEIAIDTTLIPDSIKRNASLYLKYYDDEITSMLEPRVVPTRQVTPKQPADSLGFPIAGTVYTKCLVDSKGKIRKALVVKSDNIQLNKAALHAVMQWKFTASSYKYQWIMLPFRFGTEK